MGNLFSRNRNTQRPANLGELKAAQKLMSAIEKLTSDKKYLPRDLGGKSTTKQITKAMIDIISGKNS